MKRYGFISEKGSLYYTKGDFKVDQRSFAMYQVKLDNLKGMISCFNEYETDIDPDHPSIIDKHLPLYVDYVSLMKYSRGYHELRFKSRIANCTITNQNQIHS